MIYLTCFMLMDILVFFNFFMIMDYVTMSIDCMFFCWLALV
jgi:hypothetical protein